MTQRYPYPVPREVGASVPSGWDLLVWAISLLHIDPSRLQPGVRVELENEVRELAFYSLSDGDEIHVHWEDSK